MSGFAAFDVTSHRLAGCVSRCPGHNGRVDIGVVLGAVDAELGTVADITRLVRAARLAQRCNVVDVDAELNHGGGLPFCSDRRASGARG